MLISAARRDVSNRLSHVLVTGAVLLLCVAAPAQPMRDLVEAALDQEIEQRIEIAEQPILAALGALEERTGLRFEFDEQALEWMPYGELTQISIVMDDISVRAGLARIFDGLGLAMRVIDDRVVIEPAPVLDRLGRRLTLEETRMLQQLAAKSWGALGPNRPACEFRVKARPGTEPMKVLDAMIAEGPPGNAIAQLESATRRADWAWAPRGAGLIVYDEAEEIERRLARLIDVHYRRMPLDQLLVDLGRRSGIMMRFEPGVLQQVDARSRQVDLIQRGISVRQVLELIVGNTGLRYKVLDDAVVISAAGEGGTTATENRPRVVALMRVPLENGTTFDILLREDQLSEEHRALIEQLLERKLPEVVEVLKERVGQ